MEIVLEPSDVMIAPPAGVGTGTALSYMPAFDEYELRVIDEIALHIVSPNFVRQVLSRAGKPIELLLRRKFSVNQ
ncbi:MAG: hypothetical protein AAB229_02390, partial [Candidatus Hydrogenedentota bacterium]